jgi:hypothetical protein
MGLKNGMEIIDQVLPNIQFAVNEQCHKIGECAMYQKITDKGKAVFNIEYAFSGACKAVKDVKLSTVNKPGDQALNTLGGQC